MFERWESLRLQSVLCRDPCMGRDHNLRTRNKKIFAVLQEASQSIRKEFWKIKIIRQLINRIDFKFTFHNYKIKIEYVIEANLCWIAIKEVE